MNGISKIVVYNIKVIIVLHHLVMEELHMNEQIEIEFKNLLSQEEFAQLQNLFKLKPEHFVEQKNHYFDTDLFDLKKHKSALRIREKRSFYEMTLKQPLPNQEGLLETNCELDAETAINTIKERGIPSNKIAEKIRNLNIDPQNIRYFGTLTTKRVEVPYQSGLLVLDHSSYFQIEDFEVEFEVNEYVQGKREFAQLLSSLNIPLRPTKNKVERFYNEMMKNHTEE